MNVAKLRGIIVERGMTQKSVAAAIGVCEKTFSLKMKKGVFGTDEAEKMISILEIENPSEIFLTKK